MAIISRRKDALLAAAAYLLPFAIVFLVNGLIIRPGPLSFPNDASPGMFGLGLGWLTGDPIRYFHIPGTTFNEISAGLIKVTGVTANSLAAFNNLGVALQILFTIAASLWSGVVCSRLKLNYAVVAVIGAITAFMPTMILYSAIWTMYFPLGLLVVPICLQLYAGVGDPESSRSRVVAFAALGFLCANIYLGLILALALVVALAAASRSVAEFAHMDPAKNVGSNLVHSLTVAVVFAALVSGFGLLRPADVVGREGWVPAIALLMALLITLAVQRLPALQRIIPGIVLPLLGGWAIATNLQIPWWTRAGALAARYKGGLLRSIQLPN